MEIRLATNKDINRIIEITNACANHMISQNIFQWNEQYPNKEIFNQDVLNESLFVLVENNSVIGCLCISSEMDEVYKNVKWLTKNEKNIYLHRLAVHPTFQGKGYAISLMNYAEKFTLKNGFQSIRLDTFSGNPKNNKFYKLQGYTKLEKIFFRKQSDLPFYCYEKII